MFGSAHNSQVSEVSQALHVWAVEAKDFGSELEKPRSMADAGATYVYRRLHWSSWCSCSLTVNDLDNLDTTEQHGGNRTLPGLVDAGIYLEEEGASKALGETRARSRVTTHRSSVLIWRWFDFDLATKMISKYPALSWKVERFLQERRAELVHMPAPTVQVSGIDNDKARFFTPWDSLVPPMSDSPKVASYNRRIWEPMNIIRIVVLVRLLSVQCSKSKFKVSFLVEPGSFRCSFTGVRQSACAVMGSVSGVG